MSNNTNIVVLGRLRLLFTTTLRIPRWPKMVPHFSLTGKRYFVEFVVVHPREVVQILALATAFGDFKATLSLFTWEFRVR